VLFDTSRQMIDFKTKMSVMLRSGAAAAACDVDPGDTAWIVMSFLLVFLMFPGLILFEAGLLRAKNTISVAIQICTGTSILSLMWYLFGFSLVFGPDQGGVIGSLTEHALFINTPYDSCLPVRAFCHFG
jgi:Amt family ammonium transporter